ncbi:MAG: hypothetical protein ACK2U1_14030 [Anaerolineales bacterium]
MSENTYWKIVYKIAGIASLVFIVYSLVTMISLMVIGGQPETAAEGFAMLQENRLVGMLRLDVLTQLVVPLYYLIYLGIYAGLKQNQPGLAALSALLAFAGVTLFLATPSVFSFMTLSERYFAAATPSQQDMYLAAGEALLAADMWHGSGALIGGFLQLVAGLLFSWMMVQSQYFSKVTANVGILTFGFDLIHILVGVFAPQAGMIFMMVAGPLYLVWFPLLARDFFRLVRASDTASRPQV